MTLVILVMLTGSTQQGRGAVTRIHYVCLVIDLRRHVLRETPGQVR